LKDSGFHSEEWEETDSEIENAENTKTISIITYER